MLSVAIIVSNANQWKQATKQLERGKGRGREVSEAVRCLIYACVRVHLSANCSLVAVVVAAIVVVAAHVFVYCIL